MQPGSILNRKKRQNMTKRLKKKKHKYKWSWQWHMMRVNDDRLYSIAKLCLSSIDGKDLR